ncbi:amidase family protein [Arthrobacter sp. NPDC055585]
MIATVVQRYKAAGMVVVGMTNAPEFGKTTTTEPLLYGPCHNPWNTEYSTGGSSGGSAASVASGMVPAAHGTDGGGSIRIPSAMCGLVGLKPSRGRVPAWPNPIALASPVTYHHALTTTVRDSAALLDAVAVAVHHPGDSFGAPTPPRPFLEEVGADAGLWIGLIRIAPGPFPTDAACTAAADHAAARLGDLGHDVREVELGLAQINDRLAALGPWPRTTSSRGPGRSWTAQGSTKPPTSPRLCTRHSAPAGGSPSSSGPAAADGRPCA